MFQIGDYIVYGSSGVCEVTAITTLDMDGIPDDKLFYILRPHYHQESKIFTPVDNEKTVMRPVLTKEEAMSLIDEIPDIEELWIDQERLREERYRAALKSGMCRELVSIMKTLYRRKQTRAAQGRGTTATDERYFRSASENLYAELAVPLGIPREEVKVFIEKRLQEKKEAVY